MFLKRKPFEVFRRLFLLRAKGRKDVDDEDAEIKRAGDASRGEQGRRKSLVISLT
jgi:hypothetical protein